MRLRILFVGLLLLLMPSWALATTWYVRPAAGTYGSNNGTSYATAFQGVAGITWGGGGIVAGDTLYVCGAHVEKFLLGGSGTNVAQNILDGGCPSDPGSIIVGSAATAAIEQQTGVGEQYWTVQNLTLSGGTTAVVYCNGGSTRCTGNVYQDNTITCTNVSVTTHGMRLRSMQGSTIQRNRLSGTSGSCGTGILMDTAVNDDPLMNNNLLSFNTISDFANSCLRIAGPSTAHPLTGPQAVRDNTVHDCGDGIYHVNADGIENTRNMSYHQTRVNGNGEGYCFASTWSDTGVWQQNTGHHCRRKGLEVYADTTRVLTSAIIRRNYLYANNLDGTDFNCVLDVNNGTPPSAVWTGVQVYANVLQGSACGIDFASGALGFINNNTIKGQTTDAAIIMEGSADHVTILNNLMSSPLALYDLWINTPAGVNNIVKSNLYDTSGTANLIHISPTNYTSGTVTSIDAKAIAGAPGLTADGDIVSTSPAVGKGTYWDGCIDFRGHNCNKPPDIGAYQRGSNSPAGPRAVRQ